MKKFIVSLLVFSLSACGWHLRGSSTGSDKLAITQTMQMQIVAKDDHSPLINALRQTLSSYKIEELSDASGEQLKLNIEREDMDKRTAGVGSNALTSAYEIILSVDYSLSRNGQILTPADTSARISRIYNYDVNSANSAAQEEELILREMRRELASSILRRSKNIAAKASAPSAE